MIGDDRRDVDVRDGVGDPEWFRHRPVCFRIRRRASSGVSARDGSESTEATRRASSAKCESGVGKFCRGMLAQSSSMSSILSAALADLRAGISASFIGTQHDGETTPFQERERIRNGGACAALGAVMGVRNGFASKVAGEGAVTPLSFRNREGCGPGGRFKGRQAERSGGRHNAGCDRGCRAPPSSGRAPRL